MESEEDAALEKIYQAQSGGKTEMETELEAAPADQSDLFYDLEVARAIKSAERFVPSMGEEQTFEFSDNQRYALRVLFDSEVSCSGEARQG